MSKCNVIDQKPMSAHLETVYSEEKEFTFIRLRVDTPYGPIYMRPSFNSREYIVLDIVNKQI